MTTPPRSYPDKLLDEISRRVYYKALSKCDEELDKQTIDLERLGAFADVAAGASAQIATEDSREDDDGETF